MDILDLNLDLDKFIVLVSKRNSGKSYLICALIYYFLIHKEGEKIDYVYLFSDTASIATKTNDYLKYLDKNVIFPAKPEIVERVCGRLIQSQVQTKMKFKVLVIFDDIQVSQRYEMIETLAVKGRHYGITVILSSQIANQAISPTIRKNIDYMLWRKLGLDDLKNYVFPIVNHAFRRNDDLYQFTKESTGNYQFIFFDNTVDINDESIQITKANQPPDFKYELKKVDTTPSRKYRKRPAAVAQSLLRPNNNNQSRKFFPSSFSGGKGFM